MKLLEVDWSQQLDRLKERLSLSETALAASIGLSKSMLSQCRAGARPLPLHAKFRLLDKLGYALTRDLMLAALTDDSRDAVVEADNRRALRRAERAVVKHFLEAELDHLEPRQKAAWYSGLRSIFRDIAQFGSAGALEDALDLSESELYAVERGQMRLPFWSRTAVLESCDHSALVKLIDSLGVDIQPGGGDSASRPASSDGAVK